MFTGEYTHSLDAKGRVSVPSDMRDELRVSYAEEQLMVTKSLLGQCLWAFPMKGWDELAERISSASGGGAQLIQLRRVLFPPARKCPLDKAGRILLPEELRRHANIGDTVFFGGNGKYIELWNPEAWNAEGLTIGTDENKAAIVNAVGHLGL